jgi:hypothetical protein
MAEHFNSLLDSEIIQEEEKRDSTRGRKTSAKRIQT